jgi:hypothetical protein
MPVNLMNICATVMVAGMLMAAPALAQSTTPTGPEQNAPAAQKQHTDGADNPSNPREYVGAAEWHKQHTDGADNPSNPHEYDGAAEWHKQHTQSLSHSDGSPATPVKDN